MKTGRPTAYEPRFCQEIIDFFDRPLVEGTGNNKKINRLPTLVRFAMKIGVHRDTLHKWSKKHPEFFDAMSEAKKIQEEHLMNASLLGLYNSSFAIFTAKNVCGWTDKVETEHRGEGIKINFSKAEKDD